MTNFYPQKFAGIAAALSLIGMASCSDRSTEPETSDNADVVLTFSRSGESATEDHLNDVDLYIFRGENLVKTLHANDPQNDPVKIKEVGDGMIFTTSGIALDAEGKTTVTDFSGMMAHCDNGANSAPMFLSGSATLNDDVYAAGNLTVEMTRSVARIDLVNEVDPNINVNDIIIENTPSATFVFPGENVAECPTVSFSHHFDTPFKGVEKGLFTLFESAKPVNVRIRGSYGEIPMDMTTSLPRVERNKVYTLQVVNAGSKVETTFKVNDWEAGDTLGAGAEVGNGMGIDPEYSVIPAGVTVDYEKRVVTVPASGVNGLKLAFRGETKINLSSTDGLTAATSITENPLVTLDKGYVSSFNINVEPQGKGRLGYSVIMHLRNALLSQSYDFVEVRVEPSPYQIETVKIAGHEWMCFNATSSDLEDQIYILDGLDSVEEMYKQRFAESVGNFFQYGRSNPFSPWTSNDPAANPLPTDAALRAEHIPWTKPQNMPLPEGYHVASFAEWEDLIPAGTTIPSEYVCRTGERIKATVVTLPGTLSTPSANVNKQNFKMRYVLFESLDSGNKLFVPICSNKANNKNEVPGNGGFKYENRVTYWVSNDRCVWLIDWKNVNGEDGAQLSESKWNYDGFCPVRGIKD